MDYAILIRPNHNIAFVDQYMNMCQIELQVMLDAYKMIITDMEIQKVNKATYLNFTTDKELSTQMQESIYQLSFFHNLFLVTGDGVYKSLVIDFVPGFEDDLSIRLKYNGKTNEQITRMMMMMAYHSSDFVGSKEINLLDPLCGRGTTLFEGMISNFNAYGVERDKNAFLEMTTYITRYIKDARFKHNNKRGKVLRDGEQIGESFELEYAKEKKEFKAKQFKRLKVFRGDTTNIVGAFRQNFMHLVVADLPYNVQHRGKGNNNNSALDGGLAWLLEAGLKEWTPFLKVGGCVAVSWNIYTDKRERFVEIFENQGYSVLDDSMFGELEHRVAHAITRDVIIAKKVK